MIYCMIQRIVDGKVCYGVRESEIDRHLKTIHPVTMYTREGFLSKCEGMGIRVVAQKTIQMTPAKSTELFVIDNDCFTFPRYEWEFISEEDLKAIVSKQLVNSGEKVLSLGSLLTLRGFFNA